MTRILIMPLYLLVLFQFNYCFGQKKGITVCIKPGGIIGTEKQQKIAKKLLSSSTSDIDKLELYVDIITIGTEEGLYLHSNFLKPLSKIETKVLINTDFIINDNRYMENLIRYLTYHEVQLGLEMTEKEHSFLSQKIEKNIKFYLSQNFIKKKQIAHRFTPSNIKNIIVLDDLGRTPQEVAELNRKRKLLLELDKKLIKTFKENDIGIYSKKSSPKELIENYRLATGRDESIEKVIARVQQDYKNKLFYVWNNKSNSYVIHENFKGIAINKTKYFKKYRNQLLYNLESKSISLDNTHFLSFLGKKGSENLEENQETLDALASKFPNNHSHFEIGEWASLKNKIAKENIEYLIVFAHHDKGFLCPNIKCIPPYKIETLQSVAESANVKLIIMACESSSFVQTTGTLGNINSVKAINLIFEGLNNKSNFIDFYAFIASKYKRTHLFTLFINEKKKIIIFKAYNRKLVSTTSKREGGKSERRNNLSEENLEFFISISLNYFNNYQNDNDE